MPITLNTTNLLAPSDDQANVLVPSTTAQQTVKTQNQPIPTPTDEVELDEKKKKIHDEFRQRVDICKLYRRKLIANWTVSIDYRRGKPFISQTDEDQVSVNLDWSMTKAKQAALFSQVPQVRIDHAPDTLPQVAPWASKFERKLNDTLVHSGIESAMDECLPDCINAAGIGAVIVSYEVITEDKQVPKAAPVEGQPPSTDPMDMETIPTPVDHRYLSQRISPADLLWPINFTGSNFDNGPWIGRSGRTTWADAMIRFKLKDSDKDKVLGEDRPMMDKLTHDVERDKAQADQMVGFDELFYKEFQYDPDAKSFSTIHRLVFVNGIDKPVIDEPWNGQKILEDGSIIGVQKFPIRVLTLTYITDETIPPSDSAIGRPQVNEINKARTQMIRQRERSLPVRWLDVNRIDPAVQQGLMRGTWQAMIPVQGDGSRSIGEIARASMPQENFLFDKIAKADLQEEWTIGPTGQQIIEAKGDTNQNLASFNTQAGRERARVGSFLVGISEVLAGLMCLYEDPTSFGQNFDPKFSQHLRCSILTDSTVLLDAGQKLSRLNQFVNTYAKSGWVNIEPVLQEIATLTGLDPSIVIKPPQPKPPVQPNISLRLTGVEDLLNPLALAFMIKSGQAPAQDLIDQAKQLIQQSVTPPPGMQMPSSVQPQGGLPMLPEGAPPSPGGTPPPGQPPVSGPLPPSPPNTPPPPPKMGEAHPEWAAMPTIDHRTEGGGKQ